jgi:transposase
VWGIHTGLPNREVSCMTPTETLIPNEVFMFSGQTTIDTWNLKGKFQCKGWSIYDDWLVDEIILCMQKIKDLADSFPFWHKTKSTGRPGIGERELLIGFLIKQFFDMTFRQTEGFMKFLSDYFEIRKVPHHSVLSKYNRSKRWYKLWKRFHYFILDQLPHRKSNVISDSTGYSGRKEHWRDVDYGIRCMQDWVKAHVIIEEESYIILSYSFTNSNVHDSQIFEKNWKKLPNNVVPKRSIADCAYTSNEILQVVRSSKAIPYHGLKSNAVYRNIPESAYDKLVYFATHFSKQYKERYSVRSLVETAFSMVDARFGYRIRCRSIRGRKNETQSKIISHNIRMICAKEFFSETV